MPLPVTITAVYLALNLPLVVLIAHEEANGRVPAPSLRLMSSAARYGPPLAGVLYLVYLGGDWAFFLFVLLFFALGFWLLDGLLNYQVRPPKSRRR